MLKFFKNLILILVVGVLVYYFRAPLQETVVPAWYSVKTFLFPRDVCEEPIPYVLGTFDKDFKISQEYFLQALAEAEAIWEEPSGINLFVYEPENTDIDALKINLIYDYRQQATSTLASLGITVKNTKASYDSLKAKFVALKEQYEKDKDILNSRILSFNAKSDAYEKEVTFWNNKGGAPKEEYDKLQAAQTELEREAKILKTMQENLNTIVNEINAFVVVLNRLATALNLSVEKYNTVNVARGESFEEGVYTSDGIKQEIDIYEFSSHNKLVRVLAHELGHALGLEHIPDPEAIMYELNQGESISLSDADLSALKTKCGQ